jgi:hypothetical protein
MRLTWSDGPAAAVMIALTCKTESNSWNVYLHWKRTTTFVFVLLDFEFDLVLQVSVIKLFWFGSMSWSA